MYQLIVVVQERDLDSDQLIVVVQGRSLRLRGGSDQLIVVVLEGNPNPTSRFRTDCIGADCCGTRRTECIRNASSILDSDQLIVVIPRIP